MEQTLLESFKIAPALVALVVVVYLFIKAQQWMIKHQEQVAKERTALFAETMTSQHKEHIEARAREIIIADKSITANLELAKVMARVEIVLIQCSESLRRHSE